MIKKNSKLIHKSYRFSVAPMMDYTDRHYRVIMRQISKKALLYTEMIAAQALFHTKNINYLLDFDEIEHPIALQVGGDNPQQLALASELAKEWGYDEINLNVGCPSPRVQSGNFGACMMKDPDLVAKCIESMVKASDLPVTIKHRTGIDNLDNKKTLLNFVDNTASAGAKRFSIHARKAWLKGLNAKQNREIPPLEYEKVAYIKNERPNLLIELNGGLKTIEDCINGLSTFDGVMVGRSAYEHPLRWTNVDEIIFGENPQKIKASEIIRKIIPYTEKHLKNNGKLWDICKHLVHIVENVPGARSWRKELSLQAQDKNNDVMILEKAARQLEDSGI
tara:strand:- start:195 stop:1199 length:1005 start_codon:yes stop_codon:yes gene_type:complete